MVTNVGKSLLFAVFLCVCLLSMQLWHRGMVCASDARGKGGAGWLRLGDQFGERGTPGVWLPIILFSYIVVVRLEKEEDKE